MEIFSSSLNKEITEKHSLKRKNKPDSELSKIKLQNSINDDVGWTVDTF